MPGTIVFKPIEANLTRNTDLVGRMNPYCSVTVGSNKQVGQVCKKGGKHPHFTDSFAIPVYGGEYQAVIEVLDKDKVTRDDNIGSCTVNLQELQSQGSVNRWYPLYHGNQKAGDILLQASYQEGQYGSNMLGGGLSTTTLGQQGFIGGQQTYMSQQTTTQPFGPTLIAETDLLHHKQGYADAVMNSRGLYSQQQNVGLLNQQNVSLYNQQNVTVGNQYQNTAFTQDTQHRFYTEQHQSVQPHAFLKQVPVTEIVQVERQVTVYEPVTVIKDVQYTELVPVTRTIDIMTPKVVMKEVEIMEPRIVDKQIEVIEYVAVKKMVEVIEMQTQMRTVDSMEPETRHTTVEVTENFPVKRNVTVNEPRTYQKMVEFVEPVIRTDVITKEIREPVVINETITREVGPATVIGIEEETRVTQTQTQLTNQFTTIQVTEEQRVLQERPIIGNREFLTHSNSNVLSNAKGFVTRVEQDFQEERISGSGADKLTRNIKKY